MELNKIKGIETIVRNLPDSKTRLKHLLGGSNLEGISNLKEAISQWEFLNYYQIPKDEKIKTRCDLDGHLLRNIFSIRNKENGTILTIGPDDFEWLVGVDLMLDYDKQDKVSIEEKAKISTKAKKFVKNKTTEFDRQFENIWKSFLDFEKESYAEEYKNIRENIRKKYQEKYKETYNEVIDELRGLDFLQQAKYLELNIRGNKSLLNILFEKQKKGELNPSVSKILSKLSGKNASEFFDSLNNDEKNVLFGTINTFQVYNKKQTFSSIIEDLKYFNKDIENENLEILLHDKVKLLNFNETGKILTALPEIIEKRSIENAKYSLGLTWEDILSRKHNFKEALNNIYNVLINNGGEEVEISKELKKKIINKEDLIRHLKIWGFNSKDIKEKYLNSLSLTPVKKFKSFSYNLKEAHKFLIESSLIDRVNEEFNNPKIFGYGFSLGFGLNDYSKKCYDNSQRLSKIKEMGWKGNKKELNQNSYISKNKNLTELLNQAIKKSKLKKYSEYITKSNKEHVFDMYQQVDENSLMTIKEQESFEGDLGYLVKAFEFLDKKNNREKYCKGKYIHTKVDYHIDWNFRKNLRKESNHLRDLNYKLRKIDGKYFHDKVIISIHDIFDIVRYLKLKDLVENPKFEFKAIKNLKFEEEICDKYY